VLRATVPSIQGLWPGAEGMMSGDDDHLIMAIPDAFPRKMSLGIATGNHLLILVGDNK
jgi:hypothetical protein